MNKNDKVFNLEHQYQLFLQRMALNENKMHPEQKKQLKETFFGAFGQAVNVFRDEITQLPDEDAMETMTSIWNQVGDFFIKKKGQLN